MSTDSARLGVTLNDDTKREIRVEAAKRGTTMSDLAEEVIEEWIEEQSEEQSER